MAEHDLTDRDVTDKVWRLLEKAGVAFLTTAHGDALQARPMALYPRREEGAIYLLTSAETFKDDAIIRHPQISLAAQEGGRYVAVSGLAG
ncbi:MAG: pyridoxamine 5'-phosphate oxidase family protein, partial [Hyphomonadaceae bacterium]